MQTNTNEVLAIASVPCQTWSEPYTEKDALCHGTIFPALHKPFFITDGTLEQSCDIGSCCCEAEPQQQEREQLMSKIYQVSFFLNDLTLYLDTHAEDKAALQLFSEKGKERAALLDMFAEKYYPLTSDCISKIQKGGNVNLWNNGPMPWEGACV